MATPVPSQMGELSPVPGELLPDLSMTVGGACYKINLFTIAEMACKLAPLIPGVCTLAKAGVAVKLELMGFSQQVAQQMAELILSVCCPLGKEFGNCPPGSVYDQYTGKCVDPPTPMDFIDAKYQDTRDQGYLLPAPTKAPTPTVGGCNCDHTEFDEEDMPDGATITGNVGLIRS